MENKLKKYNFLCCKKYKDLVLTNDQIEEIKKIQDFYGKKKFNDQWGKIKHLVKAKYSPDWVEKIISLKKTNNSSLKWFIVLYGEEEGKLKYQEKNIKVGGSLNSYILKYGKEEGSERYKKACESKKGQSTEQWYINRYGEEEGKLKWKKIKSSWKEANLKTIKEGKRKGNGRSLKEYVLRYGEKEGESLWSKRNLKQSQRFSLQYYTDKYGIKDGKNKWQEYCKKMDKGSLQYFTKKYGEEGLNRYKERSKVCNFGGMGLENLILKYGEEEGRNKYQIWVNKTMINKNKSINYSKISQELFWNIYNELPVSLKEKVKFAELNEEQMFKVWKNGMTVIFVDFKLNKCIIEFQGTYWHSFLEVQEKDKKRIDFLENYGYKVLCLKQKDYLKNKISVTKNCIEFLLKESK